MVACAGNTDAAVACIRGICTRSISVGGVEPRVLAELRVILAGPSKNNYYFQSLMGWVLVSIDHVSCWNMGKSYLDSKSTHAFDVG